MSKRYEYHGLSAHPLYRVWAGMHSRCRNPEDPSYEYYGGRGIKVCARWADFTVFLKDMGERPFEGATVDRIDPNGEYCPENCRWASRETQARNRREQANSKTGISGVQLLASGKYLVRIKVKAAWLYIGRAFDFFEACCLRRAAELKHWN